ncbi:MAG: hypothetical protein R6V05_13305 [Candidatus Brocadiia bacterium]
MKDSPIYTMGAVSTGEVSRAVARLLSRFSDQSRTARAMEGVVYGVSVQQHQYEHDLMKFAWITPDELEVAVEVDLRALSREYLDSLVVRVIDNLNEARSRKVSTLTDVADAVSRAVH